MSKLIFSKLVQNVLIKFLNFGPIPIKVQRRCKLRNSVELWSGASTVSAKATRHTTAPCGRINPAFRSCRTKSHLRRNWTTTKAVGRFLCFLLLRRCSCRRPILILTARNSARESSTSSSYSLESTPCATCARFESSLVCPSFQRPPEHLTAHRKTLRDEMQLHSALIVPHVFFIEFSIAFHRNLIGRIP